MNKKTVLKTIEQFFKKHNEENKKRDDASSKTILKVIDKTENIEDRTTETTFPTPSEPIMNDTKGLTEESTFHTAKVDYEIEDLTKQEDIAKSEVQPPTDDDININSILNNLDKKLDESNHKHVLNILTTRSSKDLLRESALLEYTVYGKSYVLSLIVEQEDDNYKYTLKSSYGKEIYSKTVKANELNETVYYPFEAIALRDKYNPVLKEEAFVGLNDRQKSYLRSVVKNNPDIIDWKGFILDDTPECEELFDKLNSLQSNSSWNEKDVVNALIEFSKAIK